MSDNPWNPGIGKSLNPESDPKDGFFPKFTEDNKIKFITVEETFPREFSVFRYVVPSACLDWP
jgi:hypothetical protein